MPLDGYTLRGIVMELQDKLLGGHVEKIYQPQNSLLIFHIRAKRGKEKLLISSNPSSPRIHLTGENFTNPKNPPMFCMLLRKHLQGGTVNSIRQQGMDRIVEIGINACDELGVLSTKYILCEIMGRHSNTILLDANRKVIDAIKRITPDISSYRVILPGVEYRFPPSQDKINLLEGRPEEIIAKLNQYSSSKAEKAVIKALEGIGPLLAREFCYHCGIDPNSPIPQGSLERLAGTILNYKAKLENRDFSPTIYFKGSEVLDFCPVKLEHLKLPYKLQNSINSLVDTFYKEKLTTLRIKQTREALIKTVNSFYERNLRKLQTQQQEYQEASNYMDYRLYGELITANLYRLKENTAKVVLENFYDPDLSPVEIELNPNLTPSQNAQLFFKKYNKAKRVIENLSGQMESTKKEIEYLECLLYNLEKCDDYQELLEIKQELIREGYIHLPHKEGKENNNSPSKPLHFISRDGFHIYVGKNNHQNDYLTLRFASKEDLWLHAKDIPGSHVIIKRNGKEIPETTLEQAALLAAYYSKGRLSGNVPVDCTLVKHVSKPSGAKPGMVIYKNHRTLFVTPEEGAIEDIKRYSGEK